MPQIAEVEVEIENKEKIEQKEIPKIKKTVFKTEPVKAQPKQKIVEEKGKEVEQSEIPTDNVEEPKPVKKIDLEITNPDDIKIDDKGQLGFF